MSVWDYLCRTEAGEWLLVHMFLHICEHCEYNRYVTFIVMCRELEEESGYSAKFIRNKS